LQHLWANVSAVEVEEQYHLQDCGFSRNPCVDAIGCGLASTTATTSTVIQPLADEISFASVLVGLGLVVCVFLGCGIYISRIIIRRRGRGGHDHDVPLQPVVA